MSPLPGRGRKQNAGRGVKTQEKWRALAELSDLGVTVVVDAQRGPRVPLPEYAKVVAVGPSSEVDEVRGRHGVVLDAQQEANDQWTYTVLFPSIKETLVSPAQSLWDTGETIPQDVLYGGGETIRVRVNAQGRRERVQ